MNNFNVTQNSNRSKDEMDSALSEEKAAALESSYKQNTREKSPLFREIPPASPYPFDLLGPILGPVAKRTHEIIKAPDAICGHSVLSAASLVTQAFANIGIDGREHPLSLFMISIAASGDRKSAADSVVVKPIRDYERMLYETSLEEKKVYRNQLEVWRKRKEKLLREGDFKMLDKELAALGDEPTSPLEPHILLEEPTYEGLVELCMTGQPSLGLFADEGGRMIGGHAMNKENFLKTACGLSSFWDGKPISRIRKGGNSLLYGRRLAIHLMIQETVLSLLQGNEVLLGQGLMARCLTVFPASNASERPYCEIDISQDPIIRSYWSRISGILDEPFPLKNPNIKNELSPRLLTLSQNAKKIWIGFHDEIDRNLKPEGVYFPIRRNANKAAEQALRIAGVLTLMEDLYAPSVSENTMLQAIGLVKYYLSESLRIEEMGYSNPTLVLAQATLKWMEKRREEHSQELFSLQDIYQKAGPRDVRNKDAAKKVMGILTDHGQVDCIESKWRIR